MGGAFFSDVTLNGHFIFVSYFENSIHFMDIFYVVEADEPPSSPPILTRGVGGEGLCPSPPVRRSPSGDTGLYPGRLWEFGATAPTLPSLVYIPKMSMILVDLMVIDFTHNLGHSKKRANTIYRLPNKNE